MSAISDRPGCVVAAVLVGLVLALSGGVDASPAADADDLHAIDARWNALRLAPDVDGLADLLHEDFVLTHSDGRVERKAGYIAALGDRTRVNHRIDNHDVEVRRHGDLAIVTGRSVQQGVGADGPFEGRFRFTRVWVRDDAGWRLLASHSSRIAVD